MGTSFVRLDHARGSAPPPLEVGTSAEVTRRGDAIAQEIFELVASEPDVAGKVDWNKVQRGLSSPDAMKRTAAGKLLEQIATGTQLQTQQRAKNACCLILYTLGGLTVEQIATAFGHPKGHISRLVEDAAKRYRQNVATRDKRETRDERREPEGHSAGSRLSPLISHLSPHRALTFRDRGQLKELASRWVRRALSKSQPEREFLIAELQRLLGLVER